MGVTQLVRIRAALTDTILVGLEHVDKQHSLVVVDPAQASINNAEDGVNGPEAWVDFHVRRCRQLVNSPLHWNARGTRWMMVQHAELELIVRKAYKVCHSELAVIAIATEAHLLFRHAALLLPPVRFEHLLFLVLVDTIEARGQPSEQWRRRRGCVHRVDEVVHREAASKVLVLKHSFLEGDRHPE